MKECRRVESGSADALAKHSFEQHSLVNAK